MKSRLAHLAAFLAGVAVAALAGAWVNGGAPIPAVAEDMSPAPAAFSSRTRAAGIPRADRGGIVFVKEDPAALPLNFACRPRPGETKQEEFTRMLRELVQAPEAERQARLSLLLARLRLGGRESVPVVLEYLREGRNLNAQTIFGQVALFGGASHYRDLRTLLFLTLAEIASANPEAAREVAAGGLKHARDLSEAVVLAGAASGDAATAQQAIAAITRLADEKSIRGNFYGVAGAAAQLHAEEALPLLAGYLETQPYYHYTDAFLATLWNFPEETRAAMTQRIIDSEKSREVMRSMPSAWLWADARRAEVRAAITEDFAAAKEEHHKGELIRKLAEDRKSTQSRFQRGMPIGTTPPRPGAPDSREQMRARLILLGQLEPLCTTPGLQLQLAEARARLAATLATP